MPDHSNAVQLELDIPESGLPAPEAANWFHFTFQATEIQLLVGYVDLLQVHRLSNAVRQGGKKLRVRPEVSHRIVLSPRGFFILRQNIEEIWKKMRESDAFEIEEIPGEG